MKSYNAAITVALGLSWAGCSAHEHDCQLNPYACPDAVDTSTGGSGGGTTGSQVACDSLVPEDISKDDPWSTQGSILKDDPPAIVDCPTEMRGPSRVYALHATEPGFLTVKFLRQGTTFSSVLYLSAGCSDAPIACARSLGPNYKGGGVVSAMIGSQVLYLFVGGATAEDYGTYRLEATLSAGDNCMNAVPVTVEKGASAALAGDTSAMKGDSSSKCGGKSANDVVYEMQLADQGDYAWILSAGFNSVLALKNGCPGNLVDCENADGMGGEQVTHQVTPTNAMNKVFVWVDGSSAAAGKYVLSVIPPH